VLTLVFSRIVVPSQVKPSWFKFGLPIRCERVRARSASLAQGELHAMHDSDKWRKKLGQEGLELLQEIFQLAKQGK
jgi:hypothetical protein